MSNASSCSFSLLFPPSVLRRFRKLIGTDLPLLNTCDTPNKNDLERDLLTDRKLPHLSSLEHSTLDNQYSTLDAQPHTPPKIYFYHHSSLSIHVINPTLARMHAHSNHTNHIELHNQTNPEKLHIRRTTPRTQKTRQKTSPTPRRHDSALPRRTFASQRPSPPQSREWWIRRWWIRKGRRRRKWVCESRRRR